MTEHTAESDHTHDASCAFGNPTCPAFGEAEPEAIWHAPQPGPQHWDWRCLRCSEPVSRHASWWRRLWRRVVSPPGVTP